LFSIYIYIGVNYKLAVLFATIIGVLFSFKMFAKYTFENRSKSFPKFIIVYIILYFVNIGVIAIANSILQNYYISGLIATIFCAVLSFIFNKIYVFSNWHSNSWMD